MNQTTASALKEDVSASHLYITKKTQLISVAFAFHRLLTTARLHGPSSR